MDPKTKESEPEEIHGSPRSDVNMPKKSCVDCHTTRTPLWRGGPAGPRSLCNACGIRYRKTRTLGLDKERTEKRKRKNSKGSTNQLGVSLKLGLAALGRETVRQKSSGMEERKMTLGEEEQAAVLLMALSCGSVFS